MKPQIIGKTFKRPKPHDINTQLFFWVGVILFILAFVTKVTAVVPHAIMMIAFAFVSFYTKDSPMLVFEGKHFEYKVGPLAAKQFIRYKQISGISITDTLAIMNFIHQKPIKIKLKHIREEERENFINTLTLLKKEVNSLE